jgi:phosphoribosylaminoimidazolecarboxamide formyltransferase/IMP cyclohydrolase
MRTLLASVTDKTGLDNFVRRLERFDSLRLIATRSTAQFLEQHDFQPTRVEDMTGFPEILSGRVKTLHPRVFAGILARPSKEDRSCLAEMDISEIDIVVVNLYQFEDKLSAGLPEAEMVEEIDIGGVALLRAAAKNFERVLVVSSPDQYDAVIEHLDACGGRIELDLRRRMAYHAFQRTARYDAAISSYLASCPDKPGPAGVSEFLTLCLTRHQMLRYGENPHQAAGWYRPATGFAGVPGGEPAAFPPFQQLQGKELSSNNITDAFALVKILRDIDSPACCIIKHNNPCGVATGRDIHDAYQKAYDCDPVSAFGGVYGFTGTVDAPLAERIVANFVEIVLAPQFYKEALEIFRKKKNVRVLEGATQLLKPKSSLSRQLKDLGDFGLILEVDQQPPVAPEQFTCVTATAVDDSYRADIAFAWSVVRHLTSNAIFVARNGRSLGFGIGQTSRIASVNLSLQQAGDAARGAVLASDGFFPATDNIESAARAGISVIVQPGGSLKDQDVIDACNKNGIAMLFTGQRCFKH